MRMTTEEAFIKVLQMHGIEHAFGIIGSAFMPISDNFPKAGITFWDCAHEGSGGMMADGFTRASGKMCMMIAQNGPGITNFVTAVKTAYWNHTPLLLVTPQAANKTIGQGGFQEVEQMDLFKDMVGYQEEVRDASRVAEVLNRVIMNAKRLSAPAQINMPRDYWTQVIDIDLPAVVAFERPSGGEDAIAAAAKLLSEAKFPVILNGAGVVLGGAIPASKALAERLSAPVCVGYQHNDAFPGSHALFAGPLGYNGSKAAMELIRQADVVLALGTRLNPFSTLPGYGLDYWPKEARVIQVDINPNRIGLTKKVAVGIVGDSKKVAEGIGGRSRPRRAQEPDRADEIALGPATLLDGPRGRRSGHDLERARPQGQARLDEPPHGMAGDPGGPAQGGHHLLRHRQQLRHRQCLPDLRSGPEVPRTRPLRPLRLRPPLRRRCQDRLPGRAGRRLLG